MSDDRRDDHPTEEEGEGFLSRWSQRKAMARDGVELPDEPELPEQPPVVDAAAVDHPPAEVEPGEAEAPTEVPPLESPDENSDYSAFLNKDVPPDLRQQALRKLFQSPKFNVRDGLDDYDLDFSNPEPLGNIVTAEMRYRIKAELERLARKALEEDPADETAVAAVAADANADNEAPDNNEEIAEDDNDEQALTS